MTTMTEVEEGETDSIRNVDISANQVIDNGDEGAVVKSNRPYIQVEPVTSRKYLCKMIKLPLTELEARLSAIKELKISMEPPIDIVQKNFSKLNIDGRPIEVRK